MGRRWIGWSVALITVGVLGLALLPLPAGAQGKDGTPYPLGRETMGPPRSPDISLPACHAL